MKPERIYACSRCQRYYIDDWKYHLGMRGNNQRITDPCTGTLQPAFLASDIEKLIKGRIQKMLTKCVELTTDSNNPEAIRVGADRDMRFWKDIQLFKIEELESLLSALESPKDGAEGKD